MRPVKNKASPDYIAELFGKVSDGEPWAGKVTCQVHSKLKIAYFEYHPEEHTGIVHMPTQGDKSLWAHWLCHECGHFIELERQPPSRLNVAINELINSFRRKSWIRRMALELYHLVFWRPRMRSELNAHHEEMRLLKKLGLPVSTIQKGCEASRDIPLPLSLNGPVFRLFKKCLKKRQDRMTLAAEGQIKTRSMD